VAYPIPKITYDAGAGTVTLNFTYPPVQKPGASELDAVGERTMTQSGNRQVIKVRTDEFLTLQIDFVPFADLAAWTAFMGFAIHGGQFKYYPDATLTAFATWDLEDTNWKPSLNGRMHDKFTMKMRKVPAGATGS
jgi:hypothetical protein